MTHNTGNRGPLNAQDVPRYAGLSTFARLPRLDEVDTYDVAVVGVPFDAGVTYRPGARFGPAHIRQSSRLLRPYHPALDIAPFDAQQVVDAGDVACSPFDIALAISQIEAAVEPHHAAGARVLALGGDHSIALALLRAAYRHYGPLALVHFDAHLDTWNTYLGAEINHGTPFRRAFEEGILAPQTSIHVGLRGPLYSSTDLTDDADMGFLAVHCMEFEETSAAAVAHRIRARIGDRPLYISIDIDVLDPAHAPGTGTPEAGGMSSRELLAVLRGLVGLQIIGADIVEVSPAYDHAEITGIAAAHVGYELLALLAAAPNTQQLRQPAGEVPGPAHE